MAVKFRKENLPEFSGEGLPSPSDNSLSGPDRNSLPNTSRNAYSDHNSIGLSGTPFISERDDTGTAPRFSVHPACAKDAKATERTQAQALEEVLGVASPANASTLADQWKQSLSAPAPGGCQVFVVLHTSTLVGFTLVAPTNPLSLDGGEEVLAGMLIAELLIEHDFTRSGHASYLLVAIAELSKAENLRVQARPEGGARTKFLHSAGFAPAGTRRTLEKPDESLLMEHLWWAAAGEQSCTWEADPKTEQSTCGRSAIRVLYVMNHIPSRLFGSLTTAMVTPFTEDGALDVDSTVRLAAKLIDDGCDTILLSGTTGESPTTYQPGKNELAAAVKEVVGDRTFILHDAGSNGTAHTARVAEGTQTHGTDRLLVVSPYYNRPSQVGLIAYVHAITEASDLPIMLYDIPRRTGLAFSDETFDVLAQHPRIKAVKNATDNIEQDVERMHRTDLEYYSGDDGLNFAWMTEGASGFISVVRHVTAKKYREMVDLLDKGEVWEARKLSYSPRPLVTVIMGGEQDVVMARHALHLQGVINTPKLRLPLVEAGAEEAEGLWLALETAGLLWGSQSSSGCSPLRHLQSSGLAYPVRLLWKCSPLGGARLKKELSVLLSSRLHPGCMSGAHPCAQPSLPYKLQLRAHVDCYARERSPVDARATPVGACRGVAFMLLPGQVMDCIRGRVPGDFEVAKTDRSRGVLIRSSGVSGVVFRYYLRCSGVSGEFVSTSNLLVTAAGT